MDNLVIAGGSVSAIISGVNPSLVSSDVDLFLVAEDSSTAELTLNRILQHFKTRSRYTSYNSLLIVRTINAITFAFGYPQRHIQLILRRYRSVAEILLHFDIDCCQVAWDGERILATPSALRAFRTGINVVDPELSSKQYEERLLKYVSRGFAIAVPGLDNGRVKLDLMGDNIFTVIKGQLRQVTIKNHSTIQFEQKIGSQAAVELAPQPIHGLAKLIAMSNTCQQHHFTNDDVLTTLKNIPSKSKRMGPNYLVDYSDISVPLKFKRLTNNRNNIL
jgi:hypothetical protein